MVDVPTSIGIYSNSLVESKSKFVVCAISRAVRDVRNKILLIRKTDFCRFQCKKYPIENRTHIRLFFKVKALKGKINLEITHT